MVDVISLVAEPAAGSAEAPYDRLAGCTNDLGLLAEELICCEPMTAPANALVTGSFHVATRAAPSVATFSVSLR
jgi:hypothetical protein